MKIMIPATTVISAAILMAMVMINVCIVQSCSTQDGDGGGGRGKGGKGGKGGGGGKGGSCFEDKTMVWTKNETESDQSARQMMVKDIREGSLVGTIDIDMHLNKGFAFSWTRATDVTILDGSWKAHSFTFPSGHNLTVTSPHLMIIWKDDAPYFVRADQVQIGDEMKVGFKVTKVSQIENHVISTKVAVETEEGTLQVNGILASGLCDDNPELMKRIMKVQPMVKNYKSCHFGEEYDAMCMDSDAWRNAYLVNNGMSMQI